jgi:hypothetical protein
VASDSVCIIAKKCIRLSHFDFKKYVTVCVKNHDVSCQENRQFFSESVKNRQKW